MKSTDFISTLPGSAWRTRAPVAGLWFLVLSVLVGGCAPLSEDPEPYVYQCETSQEAAFDTAGGQVHCGENDPNLPPEPSYPTAVCQTLVATKSTPDENNLDTERVQAALDACRGGVVKLVADGKNNSFVTAHIELDSVVLWVDEGVWLYASRNPELFQESGNCGELGVSDSGRASTSSRCVARTRASSGAVTSTGRGVNAWSAKTTRGGSCPRLCARSTAASATLR